MINKSIISNFDAAAKTYHQLASTQKLICEKLIDNLSAGKEFKNIIDLGCGTGYLTELLLQKFPSAKVLAVDISSAMVETLEERLKANYPNLDTLVADASTLKLSQKFDLITCCSSLQWMLPIETTIAHWKELLAPFGHILIATMLEGTLKELKELQKELFPGITNPVDLPTWETLDIAFALNDFKYLWKKEETLLEYHPNASSFLSHLKALGVTSSNKENTGAKLNSEQIKILISEYDRRYQSDSGEIYASYQVGMCELKFIESLFFV